MNLNQNPRTLLPKFFGLYCLQTNNSKNIRLVVMNNLLPSYVKMHLKYDLKGSTFKRKASKAERAKKSPTYKDLDFMEHHPNGILLEAETYNALVKTIQRDCTVLESFKIMDYSLLVGVHNLDLASKEKCNEPKEIYKSCNQAPSAYEYDLEDAPEADQCMVAVGRDYGAGAWNRNRSMNRHRLVAHSTAMESIQAESEPIDDEEDVPPGGIPARSEKGERLLLFVGIIDILQSYRLKKKLEHTFKSIIHDGDTVSVCRPSFYAQRFQNFMAKTVFRKIPSLDLPEIKGNHRKFRTLVSSYIALKHSPSKRKSLSKAIQRSVENDPECRSQNVLQSAMASSLHYNVTTSQTKSPTNQNHSTSVNFTSSSTTSFIPGHSSQGKQLVTSGTPASTNFKVPPPVPPRGSPRLNKTSITHEQRKLEQQRATNLSGTTLSCSSTPPPAFNEISDDKSNKKGYHSFGPKSFQQHFERKIMNVGPAFRGSSKDETISVSDIQIESYLGVDKMCGNQYGSRGGLAWTPPASGDGSTPTWTEGTPSYTDSSSSEDIENFSPINGAKVDRYKPTVEDALSSLTSEMVH